jgi:hypothetical protein
MHFYSEVCKRRTILPSFFSNSALEYSIRKSEENEEEMEQNGTHERLVYAEQKIHISYDLRLHRNS